MLMGCQSLTQPKKVQLPAVSEQARQECGELEQFKTGTKAEIIFVVTDTADKYHKCKAKHETVVEEYKNLEKAIDEYNKELD